jgi:hypothetical protein
MPFTFNRDQTPVTAVKLAEEPTKNTYVIREEHSHASPSLVLVKRDLPSSKSTVRRCSIHRVIGVTINAGTAQERIENLNVEVKISVPLGTPNSVIFSALEDVAGLTSTTAAQDLTTVGIMPA